MTAANLLQSTSFRFFDTPLQEQQMRDALLEIYNGSSTAKLMLDNWIGSGNLISIQWNDTNPGSIQGGGVVLIPPEWFEKMPMYITSNGEAVEDTLSSVMAHELVHAIKGLSDNWEDDNSYAGDTVTFTNQIYTELGRPERVSYVGYGFGDFLESDVSYTQGNSIDAAIYWDSPSPLNSSSLDDSNTLLIGHSTDDIIVGGNGNDYLVGNSGADILNGGNGNDVLFADIFSKFDGNPNKFLLTDDASIDVLNGGEGNDTYQLSGNKGILDSFSNSGSAEGIPSHTWNFSSLANVDVVNDSDGVGQIWTQRARDAVQMLNPNADHYVTGMNQRSYTVSGPLYNDISLEFSYEQFETGYVQIAADDWTEVDEPFFIMKEDNQTELYAAHLELDDNWSTYVAVVDYKITNFSNGDFGINISFA